MQSKPVNNISTITASVNWDNIRRGLDTNGYAIITGFLAAKQCDELKKDYTNPAAYRKTVVMERYRFGLGEYKYFTYPLPDIIQAARENIYSNLAPIANAWMGALKMDMRFPGTLGELLARCRAGNQLAATPLILQYGRGGHNTLHQDLYGEIYFPLQCVLQLTQPGEDFTGGEFVLLQQTPRGQSKAMVLVPAKGDLLIFTTRFRPLKGSKGYYRVNMKHGVSEVHSGQRYTAALFFTMQSPSTSPAKTVAQETGASALPVPGTQRKPGPGMHSLMKPFHCFGSLAVTDDDKAHTNSLVIACGNLT